MNSRLILTLITSFATGAVFAAGSDYSSGSTTHDKGASSVQFDQLDTNNDGKLTKSEASEDPSLKDKWSKADSNGDGKLDRAEFSAFETSHGSGMDTAPRSKPSRDSGMGTTPRSTP